MLQLLRKVFSPLQHGLLSVRAMEETQRLHIRQELYRARGGIPLLMKRRNGEKWSTEERTTLLRDLRALSHLRVPTCSRCSCLEGSCCCHWLPGGWISVAGNAGIQAIGKQHATDAGQGLAGLSLNGRFPEFSRVAMAGIASVCSGREGNAWCRMYCIVSRYFKSKPMMLRQENDTILLVEDGEAEVLLIQQAVAGCAAELHLAVARDATEALEWLNDTVARGYAMPRLILLDLKLPKLAGLAILRTLRMESRLQDVPIVVYSEIHDPADVVLSYQIGANSFVKKPDNLGEFTQLLREISELGWLNEKGLQRSDRQSVQI